MKNTKNTHRRSTSNRILRKIRRNPYFKLFYILAFAWALILEVYMWTSHWDAIYGRWLGDLAYLWEGLILGAFIISCIFDSRKMIRRRKLHISEYIRSAIFVIRACELILVFTHFSEFLEWFKGPMSFMTVGFIVAIIAIFVALKIINDDFVESQQRGR